MKFNIPAEEKTAFFEIITYKFLNKKNKGNAVFINISSTLNYCQRLESNHVSALEILIESEFENSIICQVFKKVFNMQILFFTVMRAALNDFQDIFLNAINNPVFIINSPTPIVR